MSDLMSMAGIGQATAPSDDQQDAMNALMPARPSLTPQALQQFEPQPDTAPEGESRPMPLLRDDIAQDLAWAIAQKNLADHLDSADCMKVAEKCKREFKIDDDTRLEWKSKYKDWLDYALQVVQEKSYPWPHASNVVYPLITIAALQFNARAYPAIVRGSNVVKGKVEGDDRGVVSMDPQTGQPAVNQAGAIQWVIPPGAKQTRANNIGRHMSWQLLQEMPEWEDQTDRLLILIAIAGCMFRKTFYDPSMRRNVSETVSALRVCVNYKAKSFDAAPRISEEIDFFPWEIESNIRAGLWLDHDGEGWKGYGRNTEGENSNLDDDQRPITFIEQHRRYDLDGDGYEEPLIVTFARDSGKLARIVVGYDEDSVEATARGEIQSICPVCYYTIYNFVPNPDDSPYGIGFGNLLYPLNASINTSLNQMFDAGHLANAGGGFIGGGASMNTGSVRFMVGEYKSVTTPGRALRENLVPLEFPGPNAVLFQMLQFLVEAGKEIASINETMTGQIPGANIPGILGLAVIQQGLMVFNSIFKRVHRAMGREFDKLFRLNRLYLADTTGYRVGAEYFQIHRADYALGGGVEPVSDPEMTTDVQQMAQGNFLAQFLGDPFFDQREIRLRMLDAAKTQGVDKLLAPQKAPDPSILAKMAELDTAQQAVAAQRRLVELRAEELKIRAAHQEAELAIKQGKDKADEIQKLSQSILNLANAKKADSEVDQGWYDLHLTNLRHQIDLLNATNEASQAGQDVEKIDSPATVDNGGGNPADAGQLSQQLSSIGPAGMAAPPSNGAGADVPQ